MAISKSRNGCVFCGRTPLSHEHVFPQWATKLLVDDPRGFPPDPISNIRFTDGETVARWESVNPLDFTVRTVCKKCNESWMSQIEQEAIPFLGPMITGSSTIAIDTQAQSQIAVWMALRALMMRSTNKHPWPPIVYEWFNWFYVNHTVPPNWHVWVGAYHGKLPAHFETAPYSSFKDETPTSLTPSSRWGLMFTLVFGYLAFKVGAFSGPSGLDYRGNALLRVAPSETPHMEWPPQTLITDETLLDFFGMGLAFPPTLSKYWEEIQNSNNQPPN